MNKKPLRLNCNDERRTAQLRWLVFLWPLWGFVGPMCTFGVLSTGNAGEAVVLTYIYPIFLPIFFFCAMKTYSLCKRHLTLSTEQIAFPGVDRKKYALSEVKELQCLGNELIFKLGDETKKFLGGMLNITFVGDTIKTLSLNRLTRSDRELFISWLESARPELLSDRLREKIANAEEEYDFDPNGHLILAYDSHKKTRAFLDICKQHEKLFWSVWVLGCIALALLEAPLVITIPDLFVQRYINGSTGYLSAPQYVSDWNKVNGFFVEQLGSSVAKAGSAYYDWLKNSFNSALALWLIASVACLAGVYNMLKPNKLFLNAKFMEKFLTLGLLRLTYGRINWSTIESIQLKQQVKKKGQARDLDRAIVFKPKHGPQFELSMSSLNNEERREAVLKAIQTWGSHCEIDPELYQTLSPVRRQSYTELWLQSLNSPPKRERLRPLAAGDTLQGGKYRITQLLATGGQGIAYVAHRNSSDSTSIDNFVIKEFMLPVYVDRKARSQAIERFENESNVLSSLSNESIVKLEDHFIEDHRAYLVLEYIKGTSLRDKVKDSEPITEKEALGLCKQMCDILTYLHGQTPCLVHRDFTPDNLILDEDGTLKLIDFNVVHQSNTNKTSATIVGKHSYMPPEQFAGRPVPQSDLYAFGATIYFLLCGEDPEAFSQSFLPSRRPDLSPRWSEVIARCTALSLTDRAGSAEEISLMLDYLGSEPGISATECIYTAELALAEVADSNVRAKKEAEENLWPN